MCKIILAFDKFKGSATSREIAQAAQQGIARTVPGAHVTALPVADGGEGTVEAIASSLPQARTQTVRVCAPLPGLPPVEAQYIVDETSHTAVMELSAASGLTLVPRAQRNVMQASTRGTGMMIAHAIMQEGCRHIVVGLGGSATTDCATGLLSALGFDFLDAQGRSVAPCGAGLASIDSIDSSKVPAQVRHTRFTIFADVDNPLLGPKGAARTFAPQKGATPRQVELLEAGARNLARLMPAGTASRPGAGAAGGTGAGMMAWLDCEMLPGAQAVLDFLKFDEKIKGASLIITGEGRIDAQTAMGKTPAAVLKAGHRQGTPVVALCGTLDTGIDVDTLGFDAVLPIVAGPTTLAQAIDRETCLRNVERTVAQVMKLLKLTI